jgi:hypothetical protein
LESKPVQEPIAPIFTSALKDGIANEGNPYEFRCRVSGHPPPQVSWFKNGICIDKSRHYTIGESEGECVLKIDKVYLEDSCEFSCKASNQAGYTQTVAKLSVTPLEPTELPFFDDPLENIEVKTGQQVKFECRVHGLPKPVISWYHYNRSVKPTPDVEISYNGEIASLFFKEAYPKTSGQYICKAKNIAGS